MFENTYQLVLWIHVVSVFLLVGVTFSAFAHPKPELRKKLLMWSGIFSLLAFLSGWGVLGIAGLGVPVWAVIKTVLWLVLSAMTGLAFRMSEKVTLLRIITAAMVACLVYLGLFKPFQ